MLTHPKQDSNGSTAPNPRVDRVLAKRERINQFRDSGLSEGEFVQVTKQVFPNGIHLAAFPISYGSAMAVANYVFRAHSILFNLPPRAPIESVFAYADQFHRMAKRLREYLHVGENDLTAVVRTNKRLDKRSHGIGAVLSGV